LWNELSSEIRYAFQFRVFRERNLVADEPGNAKATLSTEVAPSIKAQQATYSPVLDMGSSPSMEQNGKQSRALLRRSLVKSQICDIDMFERHFEDSSGGVAASVELQELFNGLFMDIITGMLFGLSTGTLIRKDGDDLNAFSCACE
ncbi:MAG: hypothetical protein Q9173_003674, partial [Seirophora scorigena]